VQHIKWFIQKLEKFDETIAWINKEEGLFQFPVSTYPELDELKVGHRF
jgi:dynein heavy chain